MCARVCVQYARYVYIQARSKVIVPNANASVQTLLPGAAKARYLTQPLGARGPLCPLNVAIWIYILVLGISRVFVLCSYVYVYVCMAYGMCVYNSMYTRHGQKSSVIHTHAHATQTRVCRRWRAREAAERALLNLLGRQPPGAH